jgi:hypothetical protein
MPGAFAARADQASDARYEAAAAPDLRNSRREIMISSHENPSYDKIRKSAA